jgi:flavin reductase (DIM6/NTAB) family NADH-FMN oxidoreductase RutF
MLSTAVPAGALRRFLGNFPTGVTVVTCRRGDVVHGATVNAFTSVSLDPPLILTALNRNSRACAHLSDGAFVVNVLGEAQRDVAMHFAGRPMPTPVAWLDEHGDHPRLAGAVGHLCCRVWRNYDGGDHVLHVAEVTDLALRGGRPLLFHRGEFPRLADGDPVWSQSLDGYAPQLIS